MKSCFLFGHADTPQAVLPDLMNAIEHEISKGVTAFYVGYHGNFDRMAAAALRTAKKQHPEITLTLVLAYHPAERRTELPDGFDGTFYPPLEKTPRRFALVKANQYMVQNSDGIVCYVRHFGNSRNLLEYAIRREHLSVNNLADG